MSVQAGEVAGQNNLKDIKVGIVVLIAAVALLAIVLLGVGGFLYSFSLKGNALDTVTVVIGPAIVAAALVERAVEVVIQTSRRFGRETIQHEIDLRDEEIKELDAEILGAASPEAVQDAKDTKRTLGSEISGFKKELWAYRKTTLKQAALVSVSFSFLAALVGVRLLMPFFEIDQELMDCVTGMQSDPEECPSGISVAEHFYFWLAVVDVVLTTFVIAGGSSGLHSIVNAITSFADKSADDNRKNAGS